MATREGVAFPAGRAREPFDPARSLWKLLTNVKFALTLVGLLALGCLLGVVIPQLPAEMRDNPAGREAWIETQRASYGALTAPMDDLQLFEVFQSWWFNGLWVVVLGAMTVCTVSRLRPVARNVHRPPRQVPDRYFETAHHRATIPIAIEAAQVEAALRRRHYRVERVRTEDGASYLFADRFPWSQYGTFVSHLALLLFLVGAVLTRFAGFDRTLVAAETAAAAPVFGDTRAGQIFVGMDDAIRGIDADGNIVDFRSHLTVQRGDEVITCTTTVNDPCHAFGYSIHQAAFIDDLARLRILGPDGRPLFDSLVDFREEKTSVPHLLVADAAGNVLFDQALPQMGAIPGAPGEAPVALARLSFPQAPGSHDLVTYGVSWTVRDEALVIAVDGADLPVEELAVGESARSQSGYIITFVQGARIPAITLVGMPGATNEEGNIVFQMPADRAGNDYLFVTGIDEASRALVQGQPLTAPSGYTFLFSGRAEASGMSVKRDPGDTFIWVAVGLATVGLGITFYVPRRRLWARITPTQLQLAGIAERTTRFDRELRAIGAELGGEPEPQDDD